MGEQEYGSWSFEENKKETLSPNQSVIDENKSLWWKAQFLSLINLQNYTFSGIYVCHYHAFVDELQWVGFLAKVIFDYEGEGRGILEEWKYSFILCIMAGFA